uniref:Protein kinase domain-containing protein n=1 Tax=Amphimedon queenslandica TaxID=400682 RepID=A0A1X7UGV0_AMPQE
MTAKASDYQPVERNYHSTVRVGDYLYMWGGLQPDLPEVHNNEEKKSMCSVMEVCHLRTGRWEQKPTTGYPPLGVVSYAAAAIGREIFYFGGYCNHDDCYYNSLYSFNVDTFSWKELSPTTSHHGPMMKANCDMIAIKKNGEDYLVVIGGFGPSSNNTPPQPGAQYSGGVHQRCNEIHFYKLSTGQWISPTVTGDRPPPIHDFTLTSIDNSSAIQFGGSTTNRLSNNVYILNFTDTSVNCLKLSNLGGSVQWPKERDAHSSVLINTGSGPHLLVVGGSGTNDIWIFDINNKSWKELVNIPDSITKRWCHSLSVWSVTPTTNWIIVFGGGTSYNDTAVIELRYTSNNDWSTSIIPLGQYQEKLQERRRDWEASQPVQPEDRREIDRLTRVLQERERELEEERREKEQVRNRLQQQLQGRERQLQQAQQQGQERERQIQQGREQERQAREREQNLQRQLQERDQQLQSRERESQKREQQLQRQVEGGQQREQDLQRQLQEREQQLEEREREFQERERQLEEQIQVAESSWVVNRREITMTEVVLGKGGWGEVKVASFRGLKVAAKCLYEVIISPYNIGTFSREMNIASKIRHPNLLQFIGVTTEGNPIILTELMPTSLRKELESGGVAYPAILSISLDVACALNYLHLFKPHPILHRDVSSANVLLQPVGVGWRAKVSDYGTVSLQPLTSTCSPGNPVYSAPEAGNPREHSPAMDVFSYGVLLIEMVVCEFPDVGKRVAQIKAIKRPALKNLIERCLIENYKQRPTMSDIINEIKEKIE